jgi:PD-(D/E)XK nuclease superfamily
MPPVSHSGLSKFETCPRQYYLTKVAKTVVEPATVHTDWGNVVHKAIEDRLVLGTPLPEGMTWYEPVVQKILAKQGTGRVAVMAEKKLAIDRDLRETDWDNSRVWVRAIIDVVVAGGKSVFLADWKTGKVKYDHDQLNMCSLIYMAARPEVQKVVSSYIWLAHGKVTTDAMFREDTPNAWEKLIRRIAKLEEAYETGVWLPKTSGLCRGWCPVGKANCPHWEPKRG